MTTTTTKQYSLWKRFRKSVATFLLGLFVFLSGFDVATSQNPPMEDDSLLVHLLPEQPESDLNLMSITFINLSLAEALEKLAERLNVGFSYDPEVMPDKMVSFGMTNVPAHMIIYKLLEGTNLEPVIPTSKDVIILRKKQDVLENEMMDATITGRVTDASSGEPLIGVTVFVAGTQTGTSTDMDGFYILDVADDATTITFTYVGYIPQSVTIGDQTEYNIELQIDVVSLDDLVVVGYGVQRRSEVTGSVGIVRGDDLTPTSFNALSGLRGKVAGVNIFTNSGAPSGSNRVIIRGTGSINASTDPLFVVDGVAMSDGIEFLNPNDIESIEVLKDASATAIYGARGANGVILVSTRRGGDSGRIVVGYDSNLSIGTLRSKMDVDER